MQCTAGLSTRHAVNRGTICSCCIIWYVLPCIIVSTETRNANGSQRLVLPICLTKHKSEALHSSFSILFTRYLVLKHKTFRYGFTRLTLTLTLAESAVVYSYSLQCRIFESLDFLSVFCLYLSSLHFFCYTILFPTYSYSLFHCLFHHCPFSPNFTISVCTFDA
jgi:hypothetical protein